VVKPEIAVVGGGLAGIAAAIALREKAEVTLFEATGTLGGRARSFYDKNFSAWLDNGVHLMLGAYRETIKLLKTVNSDGLLEYIPLEIPFIIPEEKNFKIKSSRFLPGELHLLPSVLKIPFMDGKSLRGLIKLRHITDEQIKGMNCLNYFNFLNQSSDLTRFFWEPLTKAVLNQEPAEASAVNMHRVIKRGLLSGPGAAMLIFLKESFREVISIPAAKFMEASGIRVLIKTPVNGIKKGKKIFLLSGKKNFGPFDGLILAVDPPSLIKLLPEYEIPITYNPITSTYFSIQGKGLPLKPITAVPLSPLQWLFYFSQNKLFSTSSSVTGDNFSREEVEKELKKYFPGNWRIINFRSIAVKRATPAFTADSEIFRNTGGRNNIRLAGDWRNTGLPGTLEGAVVSGQTAAREMVRFLNGAFSSAQFK
jgi:protoporphyrinogen oxidase